MMKYVMYFNYRAFIIPNGVHEISNNLCVYKSTEIYINKIQFLQFREITSGICLL